MSTDADTTPAAASDAPVRSTQGVLVVLGLLLLVPVVAAMFVFAPRGGSGAGTALVDSVDTDKVQAIYLSNDIVYFGLVDDEAHGDYFVLRDAFFLRSAEAAEDEEATPGLEPVAVSEEIGGDGDLRVNAREVLRVQALDDESEIAGVIDVRKDG